MHFVFRLLIIMIICIYILYIISEIISIREYISLMHIYESLSGLAKLFVLFRIRWSSDLYQYWLNMTVMLLLFVLYVSRRWGYDYYLHTFVCQYDIHLPYLDGLFFVTFSWLCYIVSLIWHILQELWDFNNYFSIVTMAPF